MRQQSRKLLHVALMSMAVLLGQASCSRSDMSLAGLVQTYAKGPLAKMTASAPGRTAPNIPFASRDQQRTVKDFAGRVVVLNLWASWCAPCVKELPALDRLQGAFSNRDVQVLLVAQDTAGWDAVDRKYSTLSMRNLDSFLDQELMLMNTFRAPSLPLTIIYDRKGREVARVDRPIAWDSDEAKAFLTAVAALK